MKTKALSKLATFKQPRILKILIGLYVLAILGFSATVRADDSQGLRTYRGEVVLTVDNKVYLVNEDKSQVFELRASEDLSVFNGYIVNVLGKEFKHKVGPVIQISSTDPLQLDEEKLPVAPVVLVLDIGVDKHLGVEFK